MPVVGARRDLVFRGGGKSMEVPHFSYVCETELRWVVWSEVCGDRRLSWPSKATCRLFSCLEENSFSSCDKFFSSS